jgi:hypothetical protein
MSPRTPLLLSALTAALTWSVAPVSAQDAATAAKAQTITCTSQPGVRTECVADTSAGIALVRITGATACLLGVNWGYNSKGIWVSDGCGGEFLAGKAAQTGEQIPAPKDSPRVPTARIETWGEFDPGDGFLLGRNSAGELSISGYALIRYLGQNPGTQTYTDHLGVERATDGRNDIFPQRIMVFLKGWIGTPKLIYTIFFWTVNATDQNAIFAVVGYQFNRKFSLYGGINGVPGARSMQGSHPFWLGSDRVMADEFFRPYFSYGVWAQGEVTPGLWYNTMVANNSSGLGIKATQLDRHMSTGASMWWMPTTHEFGPKGAYGDWEHHEKVATRFGFSAAESREERFTDANTGASGNTTTRLADSVNVFDPGALAPGVTVNLVDYNILSFDAGVKYRGVFLQAEIYNRWLNNFQADGLLPVTSIHDSGFYVQAAFYPVKKKLEVYGATSQIFGDKAAGFSNSSEYLVGANYYVTNTRNHRLNFQLADVNHSAVSSTFGYYTAGQTGKIVSAGFSVFF